MAIELTPWNWAEAIRSKEELALFLAVLLEEKNDAGPTVYAAGVDVAAQVRGGSAMLASESGIPQQQLEAAMHGTEDQALHIVQQLVKAYSRFLPDQLVA